MKEGGRGGEREQRGVWERTEPLMETGCSWAQRASFSMMWELRTLKAQEVNTYIFSYNVDSKTSSRDLETIPKLSVENDCCHVYPSSCCVFFFFKEKLLCREKEGKKLPKLAWNKRLCNTVNCHHGDQKNKPFYYWYRRSTLMSNTFSFIFFILFSPVLKNNVASYWGVILKAEKIYPSLVLKQLSLKTK